MCKTLLKIFPTLHFTHDIRLCSTHFISRLFLLNLLSDLFLHLDAIIPMSSPVRFLAPFVTVASLKQENIYI